ncbi:MAG: C40 family peptidase [Fimbriimonadales bacterium]|nr:C40 family peptidase [Fimbriimonadales bacterium]
MREPAYVTHRIGRLVETTRPTPIYAQPSAHSRILYPQVPARYNLMMTQERGAWRGVLMSDGSLGWVPKNAVSLTPYDVVYTLPRGVDPAHVTRLAMRFLGVRYRWGGNNPHTGLDCSGFVKLIYEQMGVQLPRRARDQAKVGVPITRYEDLRPGDRLYFATKGKEIDHTGIYIGDGYFIHSARSRGGVDIDHLSHPTYRRSLVAARR